jgi:hypothetical protein
MAGETDMTQDRTYAADVDATGDPAELASHPSKAGERDKFDKDKEGAERHDADALTAVAGQTGQT